MRRCTDFDNAAGVHSSYPIVRMHRLITKLRRCLDFDTRRMERMPGVDAQTGLSLYAQYNPAGIKNIVQGP